MIDKLAECKGHRICKYESIETVIMSCCKRTERTVLLWYLEMIPWSVTGKFRIAREINNRVPPDM